VQAVDAADVHDARRVVGGGRLLEERQEGPRQEERRLQVQVEHLVPGRLGERGQRFAPGGPGVVDEDVQLVLPLAHRGGQPDALLLAGQVGRDRPHLPERREPLDGGVPGLGLAGADVDARPGLEEAAGHHQADPAGAAGDHGDLAGQVEQVHGHLRSGAPAPPPDAAGAPYPRFSGD
jgi:hypothetical protein